MTTAVALPSMASIGGSTVVWCHGRCCQGCGEPPASMASGAPRDLGTSRTPTLGKSEAIDVIIDTCLESYRFDFPFPSTSPASVVSLLHAPCRLPPESEASSPVFAAVLSASTVEDRAAASRGVARNSRHRDTSSCASQARLHALQGVGGHLPARWDGRTRPRCWWWADWRQDSPSCSPCGTSTST